MSFADLYEMLSEEWKSEEWKSDFPMEEIDSRLFQHYNVYCSDLHWEILDNLDNNTLLKPTKVNWAKEGF